MSCFRDTVDSELITPTMNPEPAIPHGFDGHYSVQPLSLTSMADPNGHSSHMYGVSDLDQTIVTT